MVLGRSALNLVESNISDVAKLCPFVEKLLSTCWRIVGISSVGGVANMLTTIVGVVEFGTYLMSVQRAVNRNSILMSKN